MINNLHLQNFKCYLDQEIRLTNLNVFCGNNSSGKSTAIQGLLIALQSSFDETLQLNGELISLGSFNDIHSSLSKEKETSIKIQLDEEIFNWEISEDQTGNFILTTKNGNIQIPNFHYICAERWGPRSNFQLTSNDDNKAPLGIYGEYTSEYLASIIQNPIFLAEDDPRKVVASQNVINNINAWVQEITPNITINSQIFSDASVSANTFGFDRYKYKPSHVGFGLSYSLSIITALISSPPGTIIIIENPEAHLHPRGQSYLGRLIALTALSQVQVIIETHSEHIINGIRRTIKYTEAFTGNEVLINFANSMSPNQSKLEEIKIGKDAKLSSWPSGFFDQQSLDMIDIIKGI